MSLTYDWNWDEKKTAKKEFLFDIKCPASARFQINLFHNVLSFVFFSSLFCWLLIGFSPLVIDFRKLENELLRVELAGCYCFILSITEKNNDCHQRQTIVNFSNTSKACQSIYFTDRISRPLAQQQRVSRVISSIKIKKEFLIPFLLWAFWEHKQQQRVDMSQWASDILEFLSMLSPRAHVSGYDTHPRWRLMRQPSLRSVISSIKIIQSSPLHYTKIIQLLVLTLRLCLILSLWFFVFGILSACTWFAHLKRSR